MSLMTEWISALSTLAGVGIATYAASVGLKTFKSQRIASDVQVALSIFGEINRYWDRLTTSPSDYEYNMGQILAQFEIAAALFNRGILSKAANAILGDHIVEIFSAILSSPEGEAFIERCRSASSTFDELKIFLSSRLPQALNSVKFRQER